MESRKQNVGLNSEQIVSSAIMSPHLPHAFMSCLYLWKYNSRLGKYLRNIENGLLVQMIMTVDDFTSKRKVIPRRIRTRADPCLLKWTLQQCIQTRPSRRTRVSRRGFQVGWFLFIFIFSVSSQWVTTATVYRRSWCALFNGVVCCLMNDRLQHHPKRCCVVPYPVEYRYQWI